MLLPIILLLTAEYDDGGEDGCDGDDDDGNHDLNVNHLHSAHCR